MGEVDQIRLLMVRPDVAVVVVRRDGAQHAPLLLEGKAEAVGQVAFKEVGYCGGPGVLTVDHRPLLRQAVIPLVLLHVVVEVLHVLRRRQRAPVGRQRQGEHSRRQHGGLEGAGGQIAENLEGPLGLGHHHALGLPGERGAVLLTRLVAVVELEQAVEGDLQPHAVKDGAEGAVQGGAVGEPPAAPPQALRTPPASAGTAAVRPRGDFYQTMDARSFREKAAEPERKTPPPRPALTAELGSRVQLQDAVRPRRDREDAPAYALRTFAPRPVPAGQAEEPPAPAAQAEKPPVQTEQTSIQTEQTSLAAGPAPWRFAGEVLGTYIIAEDGEGVWLIDKHAAHERVHFDRMKAGAEPIMRQQLLAPLAVELPGEQYGVLLENLPLLEEFGFEAEDFGRGCLMVRGIPADLDGGLAREALEELAGKLLSGGGADPAAARDALLHTMACKASIKGGRASDPGELRVLMDKVQSGEVQYCPHGRPVKVRLSKYEIEKMFKRA